MGWGHVPGAVQWLHQPPLWFLPRQAWGAATPVESTRHLHKGPLSPGFLPLSWGTGCGVRCVFPLWQSRELRWVGVPNPYTPAMNPAAFIPNTKWLELQFGREVAPSQLLIMLQERQILPFPFLRFICLHADSVLLAAWITPQCPPFPAPSGRAAACFAPFLWLEARGSEDWEGEGTFFFFLIYFLSYSIPLSKNIFELRCKVMANFPFWLSHYYSTNVMGVTADLG